MFCWLGQSIHLPTCRSDILGKILSYSFTTEFFIHNCILYFILQSIPKKISGIVTQSKAFT